MDYVAAKYTQSTLNGVGKGDGANVAILVVRCRTVPYRIVLHAVCLDSEEDTRKRLYVCVCICVFVCEM